MVPDYEPNEMAAAEERRAIWGAVWLVLGALLIGGAIAVLAACGPGLPSPSDQAAVASYEAEQLACIAEAGTRLDADRCRCSVHQRYGRPCATVNLDAGADHE